MFVIVDFNSNCLHDYGATDNLSTALRNLCNADSRFPFLNCHIEII